MKKFIKFPIFIKSFKNHSGQARNWKQSKMKKYVSDTNAISLYNKVVYGCNSNSYMKNGVMKVKMYINKFKM